MHPNSITKTEKHPSSIMICVYMTSICVGMICETKGKMVPKYKMKYFNPKRSFPPVNLSKIVKHVRSMSSAKLWKTMFQVNHIPELDWPNNSQDLNVTENLLNRLNKRVAQKQPSNRIQLIKEIIHPRHHIITDSKPKCLVHSMGRVCIAGI